jgi:hypothetical protein
MDKSLIIETLRANHLRFDQLIGGLDADAFVRESNGKWSAAQHLDHIVRSVAPVNTAFGLPKTALRLIFGMANRPSRSSDELTERYRAKLAAGGRATGRFVPPSVGAGDRARLLGRLSKLVASLAGRIERCGEDELDRFVLPHPLLGKLTLREMLMFTAYHIEHHRRLVEPAAETQE